MLHIYFGAREYYDDKIEEDEMGRAYCMVEEIINFYKILVGKHEGRPLRRPKCTWQDNIKIGLKEIAWQLWTGFIWFGGMSSGRFCAMEINLQFLLSGHMTMSA